VEAAMITQLLGYDAAVGCMKNLAGPPSRALLCQTAASMPPCFDEKLLLQLRI